MLDENKSMEMLDGFQAHFNYDTSYMKKMLKANPNAFETFENFLPMASFKEQTPIEVIFTVKLTAMKNEDCGTCLQLNVDMAREEGVSENIIKEIVFNNGKNLNEELKEIYDFTLQIAKGESINPSTYNKINAKYSKAILTEIALAIASAKVFPTVKRVMNDFHSCSMIQIKV